MLKNQIKLEKNCTRFNCVCEKLGKKPCTTYKFCIKCFKNFKYCSCINLEDIKSASHSVILYENNSSKWTFKLKKKNKSFESIFCKKCGNYKSSLDEKTTFNCSC
jgi:hypothetical protein